MMTNIFSIFDPTVLSTKYITWLTIIIFMVFLNINPWKIKSNFLSIKTVYKIKLELSSMLSKEKFGEMCMLISLFWIIFLMNFLSIYPWVFSFTSHISVNMMFSFLMWLPIFFYSIMKNTSNFLSHLTPMGAPILMTPFLVLIEFVSFIIRPVTLFIRITANIMAGHLILSLMGSFIMKTFVILCPFLFVPMLMLTFLEIFVSFIQAFVLVVLISLYISEAK